MNIISKPILFCDFDGTICFDKYWKSLPIKAYEQVQEILFRSDKTVVNNWMRGNYDAEKVNQQLAERIGMPFEELWKLFVNDCNTMRVDQDILEKIGMLRKLFTTILITDNMDSFSRFTVPALKLYDYFDHISNSFYEKKYKTDNEGEIFLDYCKKLQAPIEKSMLFDDSPGVCQVFKNLGGISYQTSSDNNIWYYLNNHY